MCQYSVSNLLTFQAKRQFFEQFFSEITLKINLIKTVANKKY